MKPIPVRHIAADQKELDHRHLFNIRSIEGLLDGKDLVQALHRHDFYYILVLTKGKGVHVIDFVNYNICDRCIFIMRPGQVHELQLKAGSTGYLIGFTADFYQPHSAISRQVLHKIGSINHYRLDDNPYKRALSILDYVDQEFKDQRPNYQEIIKANLSIFFIELSRQQKEISNNKEHTYAQERLEELLELLEIHLSANKQVSQYAEMMNLSLYQLNAITKTLLNKTCSALIDEYIILESKRHLLGTSNQVTQIAHHLGYEDVSYFIRFFKKHTGHSPESFRQNFK